MIRTSLLLISSTAFILSGCATPTRGKMEPIPKGPDYARQLLPGDSALRRVTDPARMPPIGEAFHNRDAFLLDAIDESLIWFAAPSSRQFYPFENFTHEQAAASLRAFQHLLETSYNEVEFTSEFRRLFDIYESVGYDGRGNVLFTGYYAGEFLASPERTARFRFPLYKRPDDLVTDPVTGRPLGRLLARDRTIPYFTRRQIEESNRLKGSELYWLESPLDVYIIHINGSAKLRMHDSSLRYVGYAGKTDRPYSSLAEAIIEAEIMSRNEMNLAAIKRLYHRHPQQIRELFYKNENYVFFTEYEGGGWPAGSLGVKVTQESSLATDKKIYPRGGLVLVDTESVTFASGKRKFTRFMLDQDTGGAIQAPGRADIYMGEGNSAEILAGGQYAEGRLFYFFLKPKEVARFGRSQSGRTSAVVPDGK